MRPFKHIPVLVAAAVILLICLIRIGNWEWPERVERMTYDMRVREALRFSPQVATNLGFVYINEDTLKAIAGGSLGFRFGLEWPRQIYGRLVQELAEQGAKAVALDIVFGELRPDHGPVRMADPSGTNLIESDHFFAEEMARAGNVLLALTPGAATPDLFRTNASGVGDITTEKDQPEGILRRVKAFRIYRKWHPAFQQLGEDPAFGVDLEKAIIKQDRIILPRSAKGLDNISVPLDSQGKFDVADFWGDKLPAGTMRRAAPFTEERVWHMGVVLAARELGLDLEHAICDLAHGKITLRGPRGLEREIPVDNAGFFYIDWCLRETDPRLSVQGFHELLAQHRARLLGQTNNLVNRWRGKIAVAGSSAAVGNNLTDRGATPLSADTILVSKHWNVANSIITGRFITRAPLWVDLCLIVLLGVLSAVLSWHPRVLIASVLVALGLILYVLFAVFMFVKTRYWLPIVLPVFGAQSMTYISLIAWRAIFEEARRRHVRSIFSTMVSPKIVTELLQVERLKLGGERREISVLFADVRGFTALTDSSQEQAEKFVQENGLTGARAEAVFEDQARETLKTINLYLGVIAETLIQHEGTHDKFIGDCVMAFWGAPMPEPRHASRCVQAAIAAQRAVYGLNKQRSEQNLAIEIQNRRCHAAGLPVEPLLPILYVGTGINTGMATVGLMGSAVDGVVKQGNYTVFGREVNLASRLESASGQGRIYIGETTHQHLLRDDPALGATCVRVLLPNVKGITGSVTAYEVPWQTTGMAPIQPPAWTSNARAEGSSAASIQKGI